MPAHPSVVCTCALVRACIMVAEQQDVYSPSSQQPSRCPNHMSPARTKIFQQRNPCTHHTRPSNPHVTTTHTHTHTPTPTPTPPRQPPQGNMYPARRALVPAPPHHHAPSVPHPTTALPTPLPPQSTPVPGSSCPCPCSASSTSPEPEREPEPGTPMYGSTHDSTYSSAHTATEVCTHSIAAATAAAVCNRHEVHQALPGPCESVSCAWIGGENMPAMVLCQMYTH